MDDGLLYFVLVLLIAGSAFFSGSETALSTFNRVRMKNAAEEGDKKAKKVLKVADDYDKTRTRKNRRCNTCVKHNTGR